MSLASYYNFFFPVLPSFGGSALSISASQLVPLAFPLFFDGRRSRLDRRNEHFCPLCTALCGGLSLLCKRHRQYDSCYVNTFMKHMPFVSAPAPRAVSSPWV
jgi:hypothetical protein